MLSAQCEFVSRLLPVWCTSATFYRAVWHPHRKYRSAHRNWFALVSHSFPIALPLLLLFRFLRTASIYSLHTIPDQTNFSVWDYNSVQLQGPTSAVCAKYCCLFACTWIEFIRRNNSSDYLLQRPSTNKFPKCSSRNLDRHAVCLEKDSAAKVDIIGK